MKLNIKVGTMPARYFHVCRKKKPPVVGEMFNIVDKGHHGSKPQHVLLTEIKVHTGGGDIYFVELM
jgi:hypothetical protein